MVIGLLVTTKTFKYIANVITKQFQIKACIQYSDRLGNRHNL